MIVLAPGGNDDVLHPVHEVDEAILVDPADVPRVQPALDERVRCLFGLVPVTLDDPRTAYQDFVLGGQFDLGAGGRLADAADAEVAGQIGGCYAGALGLSVHLVHGACRAPSTSR